MGLGEKYLRLYLDADCTKSFNEIKNELTIVPNQQEDFMLYLKNHAKTVRFQNIKISCSDPIATFEPLKSTLEPDEVAEVIYSLNVPEDRETALDADVAITCTAVLL
jgi:hypothetical protein